MTPNPTARRASLMLVTLTLLWGLSFPLVKTWQEAASSCPGGALVSSLTLLGLRMALAFVVLLILQPRLLFAPTRAEHGWGMALGLLTFLSLGFQSWGVSWISPALSAFLTSLGSAWVPLVAWVCFRVVVPRLTLLGLGIGVLGVAVLTLEPSKDWQFGIGETLTLISTLIFSCQIVVLDRIGQKVNSALLTLPSFGATAVLSMAFAVAISYGSGQGAQWVSWTGHMLSQGPILLTLILLALFPTVLSFHWMNIYQPRVPAGRAALIYLLEPVFATLFSIPWGYDTLTGRLILGGGLILFGNYVVEKRQSLSEVGNANFG